MIGPDGNKILLVGNPNVGKSVIFTYLTGRYAIVSNYPGTTVEITTGFMGYKKSREVIDTPGVNSLFPKSEDERVTRDIILRNRNATVVQVADAKNIFRALMLTTQLAELGCRMVLVLNMMDEARQRGLSIDCGKLSSILGVEVIDTVAVEKRGLPRLVSTLNSGSAAVPELEVSYPGLLTEAIGEAEKIASHLGGIGRFHTLACLTGDYDVFTGGDSDPDGEIAGLCEKLAGMERNLPNPFSFYIASARKKIVDRILVRVLMKKGEATSVRVANLRMYAAVFALAAVTVGFYVMIGSGRLSEAGLHPTIPVLLAAVFGMSVAGAERLNRITLHPFYGTLVLIVILYLIYMLVGVFAAGTLVNVIENMVFNDFLIPALGGVLRTGWLKDILIGEFGLVSMGLSYSISIVLPIVVVFFLIFGILEDSGYFPRLTVLTNKAFRLVGVNGKATLPIVLGFGCVTMAVLASRILETKKERITVITLLALAIPCSAQLGVILALMSAVSTGAVILLGVIIFTMFVITGRLLSRLLRGESSDFILELPPLRTPRVSNILLKTGARAKWFLKEALPFFIVATLILFILDKSGGLEVIYRLVEPVTARFLGLPVETAAVFIIGFFRRDYGAAGLYKLWESGVLAGNQVVVALLVMSLFLPCLATLIVMVKEIGVRAAFAILAFVIMLSILAGGLLNLALRFTGIQL